jgi:hypothetical protein
MNAATATRLGDDHRIVVADDLSSVDSVVSVSAMAASLSDPASRGDGTNHARADHKTLRTARLSGATSWAAVRPLVGSDAPIVTTHRGSWSTLATGRAGRDGHTVVPISIRRQQSPRVSGTDIRDARDTDQSDDSAAAARLASVCSIVDPLWAARSDTPVAFAAIGLKNRRRRSVQLSVTVHPLSVGVIS